jgi:hypothetical protein
MDSVYCHRIASEVNMKTIRRVWVFIRKTFVVKPPVPIDELPYYETFHIRSFKRLCCNIQETVLTETPEVGGGCPYL